MSATIGDGLSAIALAVGVVGYVYITHRTRQKRLEMIHQERLAAMEKGIPLPEFPLEPVPHPRGSDPDNVIPILGTILFTLSIGAMIVLNRTLAGEAHAFWISPLPLAFMGVGLLVFHFLNRR
jgi:hypothetical protein